MSTFDALTKAILAFRDERNWKQFNTPKDMAIALALEAAELMEHFQWKSPEEIEVYLKTSNDDVGEELADVLYWVLLMAHDFDVDLPDIFEKKMEKNRKKYPVEKFHGEHTNKHRQKYGHHAMKARSRKMSM